MPDAARIADLACESMMLEVMTFPKPGLVSHVDQGSHDDMSAETFRASAASIRPHLRRLVEAGASSAPLRVLREIGIEAEAAMMAATGGVNTHRGAIFGLGLLCAAAGARPIAGGRSLGEVVAAMWGAAIAGEPGPTASHGSDALRRYRAGGARAEAACGFPSVYRVGLPALGAGRAFGRGEEAARVHCLLALMASVRDTNLLHRGGAEGAAFARSSAARFLTAGGLGKNGWRLEAEALHLAFVSRGLSAGGCADLLAMTLLVDALGVP